MDETTSRQLQDLIAYCRADGRICPLPMPWNKLWERLPDRTQTDSVWNPRPPLILGAWWPSSAQEKQERLQEHLEWAAERGKIDWVDRYVRRLPRKDWLHEFD